MQFTAAAQIAAAQRNISQTEDALSLLEGGIPEAQPRGRKLEEIPVPAQAPPGLPSTLLERRPDIRQAEQNLIAANAQIGAARALYYPQISLSAFAGGQSRQLLALATAPARDYSVTPSAVQAIFHAGQIRAQVRLSESQQREMLVDYQKTNYTALKDTSDALAAFDRNREERGQEEQLVHTLQDTVRLSELRYRGGLDSYLQVLDAQRNLFAGELTLAQLRLQERSCRGPALPGFGAAAGARFGPCPNAPDATQLPVDRFHGPAPEPTGVSGLREVFPAAARPVPSRRVPRVARESFPGTPTGRAPEPRNVWRPLCCSY